MPPIRTIFITVLIVANLASVPARAVPVVSNLDNPDNRPLSFVIGYRGAVSFTTGPLPATLNSVTLRVANADPAGNHFSAHVYSTVDNHPGAVLETLPSQFSSASGSLLLTFPSSGLPLAPHTTYWLEPFTTGPTFAYWYHTRLTTETSAHGWTLGDGIFAALPPYGQFFGDGAEIGRLSIDATILPEPTTLPCLAATASALLTRRRKPVPSVNGLRAGVT